MHPRTPAETHPNPNDVHAAQTSALVRLMLRINDLIGNPRTFALICLFTGSWVVLGAAAFSFDPWPFVALLTLVNLPQLPLMVALQVSANRQASHAEIKADIDHALQNAIRGRVEEMSPLQVWQVDALRAVAAKLDVELPPVPVEASLRGADATEP